MATIPRSEEHFEVDMAGERLTHRPTGDTLLRHPWLRGDANREEWDRRRKAFFSAHPAARWFVGETRGRAVEASVIGEVRDLPWNESFDVGDVVVSMNPSGGAVNSARRIVARMEDPPYSASKNELGHHFVLEDGQALYWGTMRECWLAIAPDGGDCCRVRRILPEEDYNRLKVGVEDMVVANFPDAFRVLDDTLQTRACSDQEKERLDAVRVAAQGAWKAFRIEYESHRQKVEQSWKPDPVDGDLALACLPHLASIAALVAKAREDGADVGYRGDSLVERIPHVLATIEARRADEAPSP